MADLVLSEDSRQYQQLAREFSQGEIAPTAHDYDRTGEFPEKVLDKAWQIGLVNVALPEELGGLGLSCFDACVIAEEISAGCAGIGAAFWGNDLAIAPLLVAENLSDLAATWIAPLVRESRLAGYCFADDQLTYRENEDGYVVDGACFTINAGSAPWLSVLATAGGDSTMFVIPIKTAGLNVDEPVGAMGLRAGDVRRVKFDKVHLSPAHVVGAAGRGQALLRTTRGKVAPVMASHAVGIARSALENAVTYSKERHTFGVAIARHQAVGLMLADMAKNIEAARYMLRKAAWLADNGQLNIEQALMAKTFAFEVAMKAAEDAVQIYGGYGYSREYPVEKLMRDAKAMQLYEYSGLSDRIELGKQLVETAQ